MVIRLMTAVVIVLSFSTVDIFAQRQNRRYAGITVYENPDFRGRSVTFRDEIADLREYGLNDRITSLELDGNQAWEVCRDVHFAGGCRVFTGSIDDLRDEGWNDRISSMRPAGFSRGGLGSIWGTPRNGRNRTGNAQSRLVLYDKPNYRGDARDVVRNATDLGSMANDARSAQVYGGTWELCDRTSRNGLCVTINEDVPDLRRLGFRNGVGSVREVGSRWW